MKVDTAHKSHKKEYFIIFLSLAFLTVLELAVPGLDVATGFKTSSLILLAAGKAFLVAMSFMHLKDETRWLKFIAAIPIVAAAYATMLILEGLYRGS